MSDNGAGRLEDAIIAFCAGIGGYIPIQWELYWEEFNKKSDPEYLEYQRLKKKFGWVMDKIIVPIVVAVISSFIIPSSNDAFLAWIVGISAGGFVVWYSTGT